MEAGWNRAKDKTRNNYGHLLIVCSSAIVLLRCSAKGSSPAMVLSNCSVENLVSDTECYFLGLN